MISRKLQAFGTTIFSEMTRLALEHQAINLSQGFPDFEGPEEIVAAAERALRSGANQYARSQGLPELVQAVAEHQRAVYDLHFDPLSEVAVFCGATEGIASAMLGLLDPGDEVVFFEPYYDSYPACAAMAGAVPRYYTLRFPDFAVEAGRLEALFGPRTRLLVLNTPHNPTGKVFRGEELAVIAELCRRHGVLVLSDEVYEHLTFDGVPHVPIATLPGMRERTLTISSAGKTFSFTGWKIGWATGPAELVAAAQAAHQFLTFAVATPLQIAMAFALRTFTSDYFATFRREYQERRDFLKGVLEEVGFEVSVPQGTYFILARIRGLFDGDDREFVRFLIERHKVAAIPTSVFYRAEPEEGRSLVRFAFCKKQSTLDQAARNLRGMRS